VKFCVSVSITVTYDIAVVWEAGSVNVVVVVMVEAGWVEMVVAVVVVVVTCVAVEK
jgi:hypothetical protein